MNGKKLSLCDKVYQILSDGLPHRSDEITFQLFGTADTIKIGLFRLGARIWDLKSGGCNVNGKIKCEINGWNDKGKSELYWYQLVKKEPIQLQLLNLNKTVYRFV